MHSNWRSYFALLAPFALWGCAPSIESFAGDYVAGKVISAIPLENFRYYATPDISSSTTDKGVCYFATIDKGGKLEFQTDNQLRYVDEAKRRGLSLEDCETELKK